MADDAMPMAYVDTAAGLRGLCNRLAKAERFGLDTEFVGERTYLPELELIQVATPGEYAIVDCRAVRDLKPFFAVLANPCVEKVAHAGRQDMELFYRLAGRMPAPVFDTQVAAAMVGYGAQPGYAPLVERLFAVTLDKTETLTDWGRRPLTAAQIAYAVDDVRYLLPLYERLRQRLLKLERWEWLQEELRLMEGAVRGEPVTPPLAYLRVRGRGTLNARGLAVLQALARWREELARERNKPRASIIRDEALVEIARKAPGTVSGLRSLRAVRSREVTRRADEVVECVKAALALPRERWPRPRVSPRRTPSAGLVEILQAVLRWRAEEARIAPTMLATSADLNALIRQHASGEADTLPLLQGWRRAIVGEDLLALLEGRASVEIDGQKHRLRMRRKRT